MWWVLGGTLEVGLWADGGPCVLLQAGLDRMSQGHMLADVVAIIGMFLPGAGGSRSYQGAPFLFQGADHALTPLSLPQARKTSSLGKWIGEVAAPAGPAVPVSCCVRAALGRGVPRPPQPHPLPHPSQIKTKPGPACPVPRLCPHVSPSPAETW